MIRYKYRPLRGKNQIRLLRLSPGEHGEALHGTLFRTSLEDVQPYGAISYAWGSDAKPFSIETPTGSLSITASLHSALQRLRNKDGVARVWADAICIDQDSNEEKGHQIRLMSQIYQAASRVVVHLGEEADNSLLAINTLLHMWVTKQNTSQDVQHSIVPTETGLDVWEASQHSISAADIKASRPIDDEERWEAIRKLMQRPWFERRWVVQEVMVATNVAVTCGEWAVPWDTFHAAVEEAAGYSRGFIQPNNLTSLLYPAIALGVLRRSHQRGEAAHLLDLVRIFSNTKASRGRDHLFALIGLARDTDDDDFDPDYESPLEVVVRRYASGFVNRGKCLDLLYRAGFNSQLGRFPSWIPDWTLERHLGRVGWWNSPTIQILYEAASATVEMAHYNIETDLLSVRGLLVDKIDQLGQICFEGEGPHMPECFKNYFQEADAILHSLDSYPTGEEPHELLWTIPIGDRFAESLQKLTSISERHASYLAFRKYLNIVSQELEFDARSQDENSTVLPLNGEEAMDQEETMIFDRRRRDYGMAFANFGSRGRFCTTQRGYAGVVRYQALVGDFICVFNGGKVPFLLRESEERQGTYRLVGSSYIHGIMHGEALSFHGIEEQNLQLH